MMDEQANLAAIAKCLRQVREGGGQRALDQLWMLTYERMLDHLRKVVRRYPKLRGKMDGDDLVTRELMRRLRSMILKQLPQTPEHLFRLAAVNIRWEILSLLDREKCRREAEVRAADDRDAADTNEQADNLELSARIQEAVAGLPENERVVVELLCFKGVTQKEAGGFLVSPLTYSAMNSGCLLC